MNTLIESNDMYARQLSSVLIHIYCKMNCIVSICESYQVIDCFIVKSDETPIYSYDISKLKSGKYRMYLKNTDIRNEDWSESVYEFKVK